MQTLAVYPDLSDAFPKAVVDDRLIWRDKRSASSCWPVVAIIRRPLLHLGNLLLAGLSMPLRWLTNYLLSGARAKMEEETERHCETVNAASQMSQQLIREALDELHRQQQDSIAMSNHKPPGDPARQLQSSDRSAEIRSVGEESQSDINSHHQSQVQMEFSPKPQTEDQEMGAQVQAEQTVSQGVQKEEELESTLSSRGSQMSEEATSSSIQVGTTTIDDELALDDSDQVYSETSVASVETGSAYTLRRLRLNTCEDLQVCDQSRNKVEAARRFFDTLARRQQRTPISRPVTPNKLGSWRAGPPASQLRGGSVSSANEEDDDDDYDQGSQLRSHKNPAVERAPSSASSICQGGGGGRSSRTLVCAVSPLPDGSGSEVSCSSLADVVYPIDGDEIRHCREAFRENRRLIEEQQLRALGSQTDQPDQSLRSRSACSQLMSLNSSSTQQDTCSRCQQRLYPVDKMELDFIKTTLNIHRHCFKCEVCCRLLRLETYIAMDSHLFCPAHANRISTSR